MSKDKDKDKDSNSKSIIEKIRQIDAKQKAEDDKREREVLQARLDVEEKAHKEYEKKLQVEHVELMRLRQGVQETPELLAKEPEIERHYTLKQKIENVFYIYGGRMKLGALTLFIVGAFVFSMVTKVEPDVGIMIVSGDAFFSIMAEEVENYFGQFATDINNDKKVVLKTAQIAIGESASPETAMANPAKLMAELQSDDMLVIISDGKISPDWASELEDCLTPLSDDFPNDKRIRGNKISLKDTEFAEKMNLEHMTSDIYIGVRDVTNRKFSKNTQKRYDAAMLFVKNFLAGEEAMNAQIAQQQTATQSVTIK